MAITPLAPGSGGTAGQGVQGSIGARPLYMDPINTESNIARGQIQQAANLLQAWLDQNITGDDKKAANTALKQLGASYKELNGGTLVPAHSGTPVRDVDPNGQFQAGIGNIIQQLQGDASDIRKAMGNKFQMGGVSPKVAGEAAQHLDRAATALAQVQNLMTTNPHLMKELTTTPRSVGQ